METGIVKWFSASKGVGYIVSDVDGHDLFVHVSRISEGQSLANNQRVQYHVHRSDKGRQVADVHPI